MKKSGNPYFDSLTEAQQQEFGRAVKFYAEQIQSFVIDEKVPPTDVLMSLMNNVNETIEETIKLSVRGGQPVSCRMGCSHCCKINVDISMVEAMLLLPHLPVGVEDKLKIQAEATDYPALPVEDRTCVFLENDICTVYDVRPLACRTYLVITNPKFCDLNNGESNDVQALKRFDTEAMSAAIYALYGAKNMAKQLLELIKKGNEFRDSLGKDHAAN